MSELAQRPLPMFHENPAVADHHDRAVARGDATDASSAGNLFKYPGNTLKGVDSYVKGLAGASAVTKDRGATAGLLGNGLSMGAGVLKTMKGLAELTQSDTHDKGVADLIGGVSGVGSGLLGMLSPAKGGVGDLAKKTVSPLLSMMSGGAQVASGASDFGKKGITVDNFVDMLSGVVGLGGGVASAVSGGAGVSGAAAAGTAASAATASAAFTGAPIALKVGTNSADAAKKTVAMVQGQLAQVTAPMAQFGLAAAAKSITVTQDAAFVKMGVTVTEAELNTIMTMAKGMMGGMGGSTSPAKPAKP